MQTSSSRGDERSQVVERESGSTGDQAPAAPPIPSFASLRAPHRRSPIDLLLPPAEPAGHVAAPHAPAPATAPRPAEWIDLWRLGTRLGGRVARLVTGRLRPLLRG